MLLMRETYHTSLEYILCGFSLFTGIKNLTIPFLQQKTASSFFLISPKNIKERQIDEGRKSPLQWNTNLQQLRRKPVRQHVFLQNNSFPVRT